MRSIICILTFGTSMLNATNGQAAVDWKVRNLTANIETQTNSINSELNLMDSSGKNWVMQRVDEIRSKLDSVRRELESRPNPISKSGWNQVFGENCSDYCTLIGRTVGTSSEGSNCTSGENVASSAVGTINYLYRCWPNCNPKARAAMSKNEYCYAADQKRDGDWSDITVGCYCN